MMAREHRSRPIVKVATTGLAVILLPGQLGGIPPLLRHRRRTAVGATNPVGPPCLAKSLIALVVIQQILKRNHGRRPSLTGIREPFRVPANLGRSEPSSTVWNPYCALIFILFLKAPA